MDNLPIVNGIAVIDLDDTLSSCQDAYNKSKAEYLLKTRVNQKEFDYLDVARAKAIGLNKYNFKETMLMLYARTLSDITQYDPEIEQLIDRLTDTSKYEYPIYGDTMESLQRLRDNHFLLFLVTSGIEKVQRKCKINKFGKKFKEMFVDITIVDRKTPEIFSRFLQIDPDAPVYSIGNSLSSELHNSYLAGITNLIHISKKNNWQYDNGAHSIPEEKIIHVDNITQAVDYILNNQYKGENYDPSKS